MCHKSVIKWCDYATFVFWDVEILKSRNWITLLLKLAIDVKDITAILYPDDRLIEGKRIAFGSKEHLWQGRVFKQSLSLTLR